MSETQSSTLEPGQRFGPFELVGFLGEGGGGEVWEARESGTGRSIALKVLTKVRAESDEARQRFEREARLAASIRHPRCVYVLGAFEIEGQPCISMELMRGGTLSDLMDGGPRPVHHAVTLALELLEGLEAAHSSGVLHRDIKPSNCFLEDHGTGAKLGDFGVSKVLEAPSDLSVTGVFLGTFHYASPEQIRGETLDERSDLYSLGATLYQLLTGHRPFEGSTMAVAAKIITEPPRPPSVLNPAVPRGLDRVVLKLLEKDPARRFGSAAEARSALAPFVARGDTVPAGVGRRLVAYVIDVTIVSILPMAAAALAIPGLRPLFAEEPTPIWSVVGSLVSAAILVPYFAFTEARWGRGLGKWLLGLGVEHVAGGAVAGRQAVVRAGVLEGVWLALAVVFAVASWLAPAGWYFWAEGLIGIAIIASTMRVSNGLRSVHDVVSRTCVVRMQDSAASASGSAVPDLPLRTKESDVDTPERLGAFHVRGAAWQDSAGALLTAWDERLDRPVWIRYYRDAGRAPARPTDEATGTGRLAWLDGYRGPDAAWDAFGAPAGASLLDWIEAEGALGWPETHELLSGLATVLATAPSVAEEPVDLSRIWVEGPGRVTLLPFPTRASPSPTPSSDWISAAARFAAAGRVDGTATDLPGATNPIPLRARHWLERMWSETPVDLESAARELEGLRVPFVTGRQRLSRVVLGAVLPVLFLVLGVAVILSDVVGYRGDPIATYLANQAGSDLEVALREASDEEGSSEPDALRLARLLEIRSRLRPPPDSTSSLGRAARRQFGGGPESTEWVAFLAGVDSLRGFEPGIAPVASEDPWAGVLVPLWISNLTIAFAFVPAMVLGFSGLVAVIVAFVFRGGPILSLGGLAVVGPDGARAARWRCAFRTLVAWGPWILAIPLAVVTDRIGDVVFTKSPWEISGIDLRPEGMMLLLTALAVLVWIRGLRASLRRPTRGLQERLSRTALVPR